jgi:hypothetical protein
MLSNCSTIGSLMIPMSSTNNLERQLYRQCLTVDSQLIADLAHNHNLLPIYTDRWLSSDSLCPFLHHGLFTNLQSGKR